MNKRADSSAVVFLILLAVAGIFLYSNGYFDSFFSDTNQTSNNTNNTVPANITNLTNQSVTYEVIIFTTTSLSKSANFQSKLNNYIAVLKNKDNLDALYYEVPKTDWISLRELIKQKLKPNGYLIILGDENTVPVPTFTSSDPCVDKVKSDVHYLDFDNNNIPDTGFYVGRIPTKAIDNYLDTLIKLHTNGGIRLTTPYSLIPEDSRFTKMSQSNPIQIVGHASSNAFYTFDIQPLFSYSNLDMVNLNQNNPIIYALTPCFAGAMTNENNFAEGFISHGASVYVANLLAEGSPSVLIDEFNTLNNERVGIPFMRGIIEGAETTCGSSSHQLNFYGDPTLKMFGSPLFAVQPVLEEQINCTNGICKCEC